MSLSIDYHELEQLLKTKQWHEADKLTAQLMLKSANRENEGWLDDDHVKAFPRKDLRKIDQLWVHYSGGKFGFSVQKKLWLKCGGKIGEWDSQGYLELAAKVGWYHSQNHKMLTYNEFMNDTQNAQNALPASLPALWLVGFSGKRTVGVWWNVVGVVVWVFLVSRRDL